MNASQKLIYLLSQRQDAACLEDLLKADRWRVRIFCQSRIEAMFLESRVELVSFFLPLLLAAIVNVEIHVDRDFKLVRRRHFDASKLAKMDKSICALRLVYTRDRQSVCIHTADGV